MRFTHFASAGFILGAALAAAQPRVAVTLYENAGLQPAALLAMKAETSRILLAAGVELEWVDCEIGGQPAGGPECARPSGPDRFMLQIVPGLNKQNPRTSGMAILQNGAGVFACLYPERVKALARDANWDFADLLGHAAAHELGHLLLRSSAHTPAGIMRARWETEDLRRVTHANLVFLPGQLSPVLVAEAR